MAEFDPFVIPGYVDLEDAVEGAWSAAGLWARRVADVAVGIYTTDDAEWIAELFEKYRVANKAFIRARDIRDDCYESYLGDYKY